MAGEIKVINWNDIKNNFIGKTLADLGNVEVVSASVKSPPDVAIAGVGLSFGASAKLAIKAYNDAKDNDDEQVVGVPGTKTADGSILDPKIPFTVQNAWLRYSFIGNVSAEAKAKLQAANVSLDATSGIVFSDYRMHEPQDAADETVLGDLPQLRTALKRDHVLAMRPGDALYYQLRGDLQFAVTVRWSDIYTKALSEIASVLPSSAAFAIEVDVSASASFKVTVSDDFVLVFWRDAAGTLNAGVRKASSRGTAFALGVNVVAKFANPAAITTAATTVLDGVFGAKLDLVKQVLDTASGGTLEGVQKKIFERAIKILDLEEALDQIQAAKEKIEELEKTVAAKIKEAAETQIGASWKYEYSRVESTQCVVEAPLTDAQLVELHDSLIRQRIDDLLESGVPLTKYLDETTVVRTRAVGFSLGIGKWFKIGGDDRNKLTIRTRRSADRKRSMVSYIGARKFTATQGFDVDEFAFDFAAEMSGWAEQPKAADFDFSLALSISDQGKTVDDETITAILDTASLWSIVMGEDLAGVRETLAKSAGKRVTARYQLAFSEDVLRQQVAGMAGVRNDEQMALALAAALPWRAERPRSSWKTRVRLYAPAWLAVLRDQASPQRAYALVENAIRQEHPGFANLDGKTINAWTLVSTIRLNDRVLADYTRWVGGMSLLAEAVGPGTMPQKKIETLFADLYTFFSRELYVRAIGRRLTALAAANGILDQVGRALVVTETDANGKETKIINIGGKA